MSIPTDDYDFPRSQPSEKADKAAKRKENGTRTPKGVTPSKEARETQNKVRTKIDAEREMTTSTPIRRPTSEPVKKARANAAEWDRKLGKLFEKKHNVYEETLPESEEIFVLPSSASNLPRIPEREKVKKDFRAPLPTNPLEKERIEKAGHVLNEAVKLFRQGRDLSGSDPVGSHLQVESHVYDLEKEYEATLEAFTKSRPADRQAKLKALEKWVDEQQNEALLQSVKQKSNYCLYCLKQLKKTSHEKNIKEIDVQIDRFNKLIHDLSSERYSSKQLSSVSQKLDITISVFTEMLGKSHGESGHRGA